MQQVSDLKSVSGAHFDKAVQKWTENRAGLVPGFWSGCVSVCLIKAAHEWVKPDTELGPSLWSGFAALTIFVRFS